MRGWCFGALTLRWTAWCAIAVSVVASAAATPARASDTATAETKQPPAAQSSVIPKEYAKLQREKINRLFTRLKSAPNRSKGEAVVQEIWRAWTNSGNVDVDALMRQAQLAMREGGTQEALGALDRVIEIAPDYAEGWNRRATLLYMVGRHSESVRDIQETLRREPRHFGALAGLGMIYMSSKNWSGALKA
ncbi:MAG: tetratricopeptide repeat protein, partial [Pseudomonadota bacterium]